ncbi:acetamidase/formamidase family protein [Candidatus Latescibacterota bacterium]
MKRITREQAHVFAIDHLLDPVITVKPGERFVLETEDAADGYLRDETILPKPENRPTHVTNPPLLNPVAGPVVIEGAEKGDTIKVIVENIAPDTQGYTILEPGLGLFGDSIRHPKIAEYLTRILHITPDESGNLRDGDCSLNVNTHWKLAPFIGTLCLAPEREILSTVMIQGPYGGNLDSREFCAGAHIYLNCYHDGGLLFAGDVHGSQGDGELTGTANEIRAELTLSCDVLKGKSIPHVRVERSDTLIGLFCDKPLENAVRGAVSNLLDWMTVEFEMDKCEAYLLIGTCPDFRINIYQMVDIPGFSYTVGAEIPRKYVSM